MSNGGLLQKAMEVQEANDDIIDMDLPIESERSSITLGKIISVLGIGVILPLLILMWFGVYIDIISITILTPLVILMSLVFVWWRLEVGRPNFMGGSGINTTPAAVVIVTFIILLGTPTLLSIALTGEMSLGEVDFNDDASEMSIKIRQNGGSGTHDATVSISQSGSEIWSESTTFSFDFSDGQGDYGKITIDVEDFYSNNALPSDSTKYELTLVVGAVVVGGVGYKTFTKSLDSNYLSRTITGAESSSTASLSENPDDCGDKERCLKGVALTGSAGLAASVGYPPAGMPFADYTMKVTMYYDSTSMAIDYPIITVENTVATWDSNGGEWGAGTGIVGDLGSSLSLGGSEFASDIQADIIPISAWEVNDYGCYTVSIEINQQSPWSGTNQGSISSESYYLFEKAGSHANEDGESETWTSVENC